MKHIKIALLLVFVALMALSIGCERDDICPESTPTTPKLLIEFYDSASPENLKAVPKLKIQGLDNSEVLPGYDGNTTNKLSLPLKTDTTATQFTLQKNAPDGNIDTITIKYTTELVFVSRACGYKTVFKNVSITIEPDTDGNWILARQSVEDNQSVEDETTAHFYLFH